MPGKGILLLRDLINLVSLETRQAVCGDAFLNATIPKWCPWLPATARVAIALDYFAARLTIRGLSDGAYPLSPEVRAAM